MPSIPYIAHLLGVASLAFEYGSDKALLHAAEYFRREGFRNLYNLRGGIDAWSQFVDPSVLRY